MQTPLSITNLFESVNQTKDGGRGQARRNHQPDDQHAAAGGFLGLVRSHFLPHLDVPPSRGIEVRGATGKMEQLEELDRFAITLAKDKGSGRTLT